MDRLSAAFSALADPTRRAILARLAQGQAHVGEIGKPFRMSGPAISRHLRVLESAGLIAREVDAQRRVCRLRGEGLAAAHEWMEQYRQFWEASLDRLVELLEQPAATTATTRPTPRARKRSASTPITALPRTPRTRR
ncbi:MAG: metalloregulator ArsR/SmtB family transcription factor [Caldimonas sp.]